MPKKPILPGKQLPGQLQPAGPIKPDIDIKRPPGAFVQSSVSSLFQAGRPGTPAVRPDDLLAVRFELVNLQIQPGTPPRVSKTASGDSFIVLHFPPQSIAEEVFFETAPPGMDVPDVPPPPPGIEPKFQPASTETPAAAPIRARVANESRVAFKVPSGFQAPYTIDGLLDACNQLGLNVPANALPRTRPLPVLPGFVKAADLAKLPKLQRARLALGTVRSRQLALSEGGQSAVVRARIGQFELGSTGLGSLKLDDARRPVLPTLRPKPGLPSARQTAIEMPWRLILSPHADERFQHATSPVTSALTGRTELWHTRLIAPAADGSVIQPPHLDPRRTVRAVWALTGEGSGTPMQSAFPSSTQLPDTGSPPSPFLATLDDFDRFQIAHLSSNFELSNYSPEPIDTHQLMLSSLGGWLDARGEWDPPGLSVEEWSHRASMGRDHYVRVVYKGFLFPFGHRVSLIKVSERKFHNGTQNTPKMDGNPAYLRQRMFIVVRERERTFVDEQLLKPDGSAFQRQFPFNSVRILTTVTPNLDLPNVGASVVLNQQNKAYGQKVFWPSVGGQPFAFRCVGTDIDGRKVSFELPLIFMDNSMASPRFRAKPTDKFLSPDYVTAELHAAQAAKSWQANPGRRRALLKGQRMALAPSLKPGDTMVEAVHMDIGVETLAKGLSSSPKLSSNGLRSYSEDLKRPMFYPSVTEVEARIAALSQLTGSGATNVLSWNAHYLKQGFAGNVGEVFANVAGNAKLDFSSQGDRSGGFVMPNLSPKALTRASGPASLDPAKLVSGTNIGGTDLFPTSLSDLPLPLLFGCIPLGEVIQAVANLGNSPDKMPRFASEAATQLESFIGTMVRAFEMVRNLGGQGTSLGKAAVDVLRGILADLQAQAMSLVQAETQELRDAMAQLQATFDAVRAKLAAVVPDTPDGASSGTVLPSIDSIPSLASIQGPINNAISALDTVEDKLEDSPLPAGFKQGSLGLIHQARNTLQDVQALLTLIPQGKALFQALDGIVGNPDGLGDLLGNPAALGPKITALKNALADVRTTLAGFRLLEGAARKAVLDVLQALVDILDVADDILEVLAGLLGEELTIRFDWSPEIKPWGFEPGKPLFRPNDAHGFVVAVEAKVRKDGSSAPKISVVCGLKHFDLILINPAAFLELNFEKIEFSVDTGAKMDVDVLLSDIKFVGPLSFVETLKDLIPLDGFSDPPYLDITAKGIDAGFSVALPNIAVGMFSISNISLGAGFTVPFIGQPLSVRFNFCTREQPFNLTVSMFGGGGFFGVTISPDGVQILEAAFEFGASVSIDFGVASGGVEVMAGIYFRMEQDAASLTGYFRLGGHVSVLGLISASLELYLELRYEFETGKAIGKAQLTIEVEVFFFSADVTITCERKFAGSNGDPTFRQLVGFDPSLSLAEELAQIKTGPADATDYAWREYCDAFA